MSAGATRRRWPRSRKWCFVPECNTSPVRNPEKLFVNVPRNQKIRKKWFKAVGRAMPTSKSTFYCCEDHFNLPEDMANYMRHKMMGGPIVMKKNVVPHIFHWREDRERAATRPNRALPAKGKRKEL